ncbi:hypothetical protein LTR78_010923 [Recurvomyces mirabilis]|uniref:Uncharacterized protein n=1 Tax=Recurvomyces mirabilis TaxID=574656 RepID=A0AAE0TM77_9PEZI|nr:hypothetical protein LTR78_010923 [Recurvomyces mirabilis]
MCPHTLDEIADSPILMVTVDLPHPGEIRPPIATVLTIPGEMTPENKDRLIVTGEDHQSARIVAIEIATPGHDLSSVPAVTIMTDTVLRAVIAIIRLVTTIEPEATTTTSEVGDALEVTGVVRDRLAGRRSRSSHRRPQDPTQDVVNSTSMAPLTMESVVFVPRDPTPEKLSGKSTDGAKLVSPPATDRRPTELQHTPSPRIPSPAKQSLPPTVLETPASGTAHQQQEEITPTIAGPELAMLDQDDEDDEDNADGGVMLSDDGWFPSYEDDGGPIALETAQPDDIGEVNKQIEDAERRENQRQNDYHESLDDFARLIIVAEDIESEGHRFGEPMVKILRHLENTALAAEFETDCQINRTTMTADLGADFQEYQKNLTAGDIMTLLSEDTGYDAWATDSLVGFMVAIAQEQARLADSTHYVADPSVIHNTAARSGPGEERGTVRQLSTAESVKHLERLIADALPQVMNPQLGHDVDSFPLPDMPACTNKLSLIYNIGDLHWVHVLLTVNDERTAGTITLHDSMGRKPGNTKGRRKLKGMAMDVVGQELPKLAHLISMRPSLGWHKVVWAPVQRAASPQQVNTSDCAFFSWLCTVRSIRGEPVMQEEEPVWAETELGGKSLRWIIMRELSVRLMGEEARALFVEEHSSSSGESPSPPPEQNTGGGDSSPLSWGPTPSPQQNRPTRKPRSAGARSAGKASVQDTGRVTRSQTAATGVEKTMRPPVPKYIPRVRPVQPSQRRKGVVRVTDIYPVGTQPEDVCDRTTIYEYMQSQGQALTIQQICEGVSDKLGELSDAIPILTRVTSIVESTPSSFVMADDAEDDAATTYSIQSGPGRSLDRETQQFLLEDPVMCTSIPDDIEARYHLRVSCARYSANQRCVKAFDGLEEAAEKLMQEHHYRFHSTSTMPTRVFNAAGLAAGLQNPDGCWYRYAMSPRSSMSLPFQSSDDEEVVELLNEANDRAVDEKKLEILLLMYAWNGLTTNNDAWGMFQSRWPNLNFSITMVVQASCVVDPSHFRIDCGTTPVTAWGFYSVSTLAWLYEADAVSVDDIRFLADDPDALEWTGDDNFQCIHGHAQFLESVARVQHLRLDTSNFHNFDLRRLNSRHNRAAQLTSYRTRNFINLARDPARACELLACQEEQATDWIRGQSSSVAVRCASHPPDLGVDEAANHESPFQSQSSSWCYRCRLLRAIDHFDSIDGTVSKLCSDCQEEQSKQHDSRQTVN